MLQTLEDAEKRYGEIINGVWLKASQYCVFFDIPKQITLMNNITKQRQKHIYCNLDMEDALKMAFSNVIEQGLNPQLETFDGCFNIRDVRGTPGKLSTHAYALAIDLNAATNKLGCDPSMSKELVECFTDAGFIWGGSFTRKDGMHFQFANW